MADHPMGLPRGVTAYYAALAESRDPAVDPIAAQFVPQEDEERCLPYESRDPLGDELYRVGSRVLHHYHDRILVLANDRCAVYCRHCFRRHFTGSSTGRITQEEIREAAEYVRNNTQVEEALISGGDPLMLPDRHLEELLSSLRTAREDLILRVATRIPVVQPSRVTSELAEMLGRHAPLWMVIHANHPRELTKEFGRAIGRIANRGVPILNQAVLLRGINDDAKTLEHLFRGLLRHRVKPYYLFQGDLASGTRHFRTSIQRGLDLMDELRERLSGMAMPTYAVDLPEGGGKIPLNRGTVVGREEGWYLLQGPGGSIHRYPVEE